MKEKTKTRVARNNYRRRRRSRRLGSRVGFRVTRRENIYGRATRLVRGHGDDRIKPFLGHCPGRVSERRKTYRATIYRINRTPGDLHSYYNNRVRVPTTARRYLLRPERLPFYIKSPRRFSRFALLRASQTTSRTISSGHGRIFLRNKSKPSR